MASLRSSNKKILFGQDNNALTFLLVLNIVVFLIMLFLEFVYALSFDKAVWQSLYEQQIVPQFVMPEQPQRLLPKAWTIITHMFANIGVLSMLSKMLWLYAFGYILQDLAGNNKIFPVYIYGALSGALFYIVSALIFTSVNMPAYYTGSGAGLMAIVTATITLAPQYRFFRQLNGGIPLWVLGFIFILLDIGTSVNEPLILIAHIAAGIAGYIYIKLLQKGTDTGAWMGNLVLGIDNFFSPAKKQEAHYKQTRTPFVKKPNLTQQRLDMVLDKINTKGIESLTKEEKDFLDKAAKENLL